MASIGPNNYSNAAAEALYAILIQFVELKEGVAGNPYYQWSSKDFLYVCDALDRLDEELRVAFLERFKDYQIAKLLAIPHQGSA